MKENFKHIDFEKSVKEKLDGFEYPLNNASWNSFKKSIPGKSISATFLTIIITSSVILLLILGYFVLQNDSNIKLTHNNILQKKNIIPEKVESEKIYEAQENIIISKDLITHEEKIVENNSENIEKIELIESNSDVKNTNINNSTSEKINNVKIPVSIDDTIIPSANFILSSTSGCMPLTIKFMPDEISDSIVYYWNFGNGDFSNSTEGKYTYHENGEYTISLTVKYFHSEKIVTGYYPVKIRVYPVPKCDFNWTKNNSEYVFTSGNSDCENIWIFNDRKFFSETFTNIFDEEKTYQICLISKNIYGCSDSLTQLIKVEFDFKIHVPTGFTPDGDNVNDLFGPVIYNLNDRKYSISIFSGAGQLVFQSNDINFLWDGKILNSQKNAEQGIYIWEVILQSPDGKLFNKVGHVTLIR